MKVEPSAGFLLVDKPRGWTSHDVVAKIRKQIGGKVGHAGTLDPMATGLLVLGIGGATRLLRFVQGAQKEYIATAQFGVATDSLDADGAILSREPLPVTGDQVVEVMKRFTGEIMQVPPMVSARRVEGKRLYELAREGKVVEREARAVTIYRLELIDIAPSDYPEVTFRAVCSTGTYIRTLADDLGRASGGRAHLSALRRVRNGPMHVNDALTVDGVVSIARDGELGSIVLPPEHVLSGYPEVRVDDAMAFRVRNGRDLPDQMAPDDAVLDTVLRIGDRDGNLLAMYKKQQQGLVAEVVLH
ncbi:MAG: tRNA pseudouridine(55) synthase TruB [Acidimicrobiia bacterium]|nr:MAG: tRNA pseudouridine(55) synthase TruB [Acidimicrobiia bacterium]